MLSKPQRNNNTDTTHNILINLHRRSRKYFRNRDDEVILREIASIQSQQQEFENEKMNSKFKNINKLKQEKMKEKRKLKRIKKYIKICSMNKACTAADNIKIVKITRINHKLWKSKFIKKEFECKDCIIN